MQTKVKHMTAAEWKAHTARNCFSKDTARDYLVRLGTHDKNGNLTERYKMKAIEETIYICEDCRRRYTEQLPAEQCEESHKVLKEFQHNEYYYYSDENSDFPIKVCADCDAAEQIEITAEKIWRMLIKQGHKTTTWFPRVSMNYDRILETFRDES